MIGAPGPIPSAIKLQKVAQMPSSDSTWESKRCNALLDHEADPDDPEARRCRKWAIRGAKRCGTHGSGTKLAKKAAAQKVRTARVAKAVATYGLPIEISPVDAFLEELARTNGHVQWLGNQIQDLDDGEIIWGAMEQTERSSGVDEQNFSEEKVGAIAHMWVTLYFRERQHLARLADTMIKNGLAEMQVMLQARQIEIFEAAMLGMIQDLRHDPADPNVRNIIASRLSEAARAAQQPMALER